MSNARARLRGLYAAQLAIDAFIEEAQAAREPGGRRLGGSREWWEGRFQGLVAAKTMLILADWPEHADNAEKRDELIANLKKRR